MSDRATLGGKPINPSNFIEYDDLKGKDVTLIISAVTKEEVFTPQGKKDLKAILSFEKATKRLVVNRGRERSLVRMYGRECEGWVGKPATLYAGTTKVRGVEQNSVQIRIVREGANQENANV